MTQTLPQRTVKCHNYVKRLADVNAPVAHSFWGHKKPAPAPPASWTVPALCKDYRWPTGLTGRGTIGIIELGGGWTTADMTMYFAGVGQPMPTITNLSVDGTVNSMQNPPSDDDYEVALDIQLAAASYFMATGLAATIIVAWAQDIPSAVAALVESGCATITNSWGADEASWGLTAAMAMEAAAAAAAAAGVPMFAASGDNDSSDGGPEPVNVDCPASCPHVIGCGGTTKTATSETVWNDNPGKTNGEGTGGGYSLYFPVQSYQLGVPLAPKRIKGDKDPGTGRMVPDLCANADPVTGYEIVVYGKTVVVGGTSAVAPLLAGLFAAFAPSLGFVNPKLYLNQKAFNDITVGSNGDYSAAAGPDPCSGIGSPIGTALAGLFAAAA